MRRFLSLHGNLTLLSLALALYAAPAQAQLAWDNGTPRIFGLGCNFSQIAPVDDFVLDSATTLTAIRFWIYPIDAGAPEFSGTVGWAIHPDVGGSVGPALASGTASGAGLVLTDSGIPNITSLSYRQADFAITPTDLPAGTYWLQLREGPINSAADGSPSFWAESSLQQGSFGRSDFPPTNPTTFPGSFDRDLAFQLFESSQGSAAPEPGTLALFGAGYSLAGVGMVGRIARRKR